MLQRSGVFLVDSLRWTVLIFCSFVCVCGEQKALIIILGGEGRICVRVSLGGRKGGKGKDFCFFFF